MAALARYFALLGMLAALAAAAYVRSNAPLAVSKHVVNGRTVKYQERWNGCYYDTRAGAVHCTEN